MPEAQESLGRGLLELGNKEEASMHLERSASNSAFHSSGEITCFADLDPKSRREEIHDFSCAQRRKIQVKECGINGQMLEAADPTHAEAED